MASQDVSARIRARLAEDERNMAWLARKVDRDLSTVYRWLTDEYLIPRRLLPRLAEVLELELAELVDLYEIRRRAARRRAARKAAA